MKYYMSLAFPVSATESGINDRLLDSLTSHRIQAATLADLIKVHLGPIFLHIDEISSIHSGFDDVEALTTFCHIWRNVLFPFIESGHFVYCNGRSPLLYDVGKL